jgi:hypothetical protein
MLSNGMAPAVINCAFAFKRESANDDRNGYRPG